MNEQELRELLLKTLNSFCQMDNVYDFSSTKTKYGVSVAKLAAIDEAIDYWRELQPIPFDGVAPETDSDEDNDYGLEAVA